MAMGEITGRKTRTNSSAACDGTRAEPFSRSSTTADVALRDRTRCQIAVNLLYTILEVGELIFTTRQHDLLLCQQRFKSL